jgi:hypothetical protein
VNIPVAVVAVILAMRLVPNTKHDQTARIPDVLGGALLIIGIGALALGLVEAPDWGWSSGGVIGSFAAAAASLVMFVWRSGHHPTPVVQLSLFRDRIFTSGNIVPMLVFASFGIVLLSAILWMQGHWGYSAIRTGFGTAPGPVLFAIFAAVADVLHKKFRIKIGHIAAAGVLVAAVGAYLLTALLENNPSYFSSFLPGWALVGAGFGAAVPVSISAATSNLPPEDAATGSAIVSMAVQLGSVIGISVLVALLGKESSAADLEIYKHAWWVAVGIAAAACLTAFGLNPRRGKQHAGA